MDTALENGGNTRPWLLLDDGDYVEKASPEILSFLCAPPDRVLGRDLRRFVVPEDRGPLTTELDFARARGSSTFLAHLRPMGRSPRSRRLHILAEERKLRVILTSPSDRTKSTGPVRVVRRIGVADELVELVAGLRSSSGIGRSCLAIVGNHDLPLELRVRALAAITREYDRQDARIEQLISHVERLQSPR